MPRLQAARGAALSESPAQAPSSRPSRHRRIGLLATVAAFVLAADVLSKVAVVHLLADHDERLLGGFLTLTLTRNSGAAFSVGQGQTWVFTAVAVVVAVVIVRSARRIASAGWAVVLGGLLGGALGNLVDRIFREPGPLRGHVVDWIRLPHWPVFNLADSAIVVAAVLAVLLTARGVTLDGTHPDVRAGDDPPP